MKPFSFKEFLREAEKFAAGYSVAGPEELHIPKDKWDAAKKAVPDIGLNTDMGGFASDFAPYQIISLERDPNRGGNVIAAKIKPLHIKGFEGQKIHKKTDQGYMTMPQGTELDTSVIVIKVDPEKLKASGGNPQNPSIDDLMSAGFLPPGGAAPPGAPI